MIGNLVSSVFGGGGAGGIMGLAMNLASVAFPPLGIANAVSNLVLQGVGQAVGQAMNTLCRESGMPKFIGELVQQIADKVLGGMKQDCDPGCADHVGGDRGIRDTLQDFVKDLCDKIIENTRKNLDKDGEGCGEGGGKGGKGGKSSAVAGSWLQAIAIAMGEIAGDKAAQMVELSKKMSDLNAEGQKLNDQKAGLGKDDTQGQSKVQDQQQANAREFSVTQAQFQATSQEFSILQNTFSNAIKSIGEGLTTMGRKG